MKHTQKRMICSITSCLLLIALLLSCIPGSIFAASVSGDTYTDTVDHYSSYSTITVIGSIGSCPAMQGLALDGTYLYTAKTNDGDTTVTLSRTHKTTGDMVYLTNAANGTNYFYQLAHANDLAYCEIDGVKTLFVATGGAGVGEYSLVRFALDGTTATEVGHYNVKYNGSESYLAGVKVMSVNENDIDLIFKRGKYIFKGTVGKTTTSGDLNVSLVCTLDFANSTINGSAMDLSAWVQQGFGYIDNKIFVPLSGNHQDTTTDTSLIMVYDIEGVSGTITNDPSLSVMITDSTFVDLFEIESCQIDPTDGKLYFNTNRRKSSTDGNHDGVHYVNNYIYDPARGDTESSAYRWEVIDDQLTSVTDNGAVFNAPCKKGGYISGGTFNSARYYLSRSVVLKHDEPWVLEWKNTGGWSSGALLFSNNAKGAYEGNRFLYRRQNNSIIALGEYSGGAYNNYGIELATAGVDGTVTHTYTLKNRIATDGTNMVYLFVDGEEIGPMNNYFINGTSQGTTSDWISGKDFTFSYLGSMGHPIKNCAIDYIQVWGKGYIDQYDEPNTFRWETSGSAVSAVTETGYTTNTATAQAGTCSSGVLSGYRATLDESITLLHDRPWSIEWQSDSWSGGSMILSSHERGKTVGSPYIYRNASSLTIGYYDGSLNNNYGIKFEDYGIDPAANHTYRLTNRISLDGSNMVYLFVDGVEIGPMNGYFIGGTAQGTTSDWLSGKDFSFPYIGTLQYTINSPMSYLQVWEGGIPQDMIFESHRWEPQNDVLTSITTDGNTQNTATVINGTLSGTTFSDSWYALEESIVLLHDNAWSIKWRSQGTWKDTTNGAMFLASSLVKNQPNAAYLYRRNASTFIAFGERRDGAHQNYGVSLSGHGIDGTVDHTYELINRVYEDGTNMVYLFVDDVEIGPMNEYFLGGTAQGTTSDWVNGKDFVFSYLGTPQFPIDNCSIDYIQINEGCEHTYGDWSGDDATCTEDATQTRTCTKCGDSEQRTVPAIGHSYSSQVTPPTCDQEGYTTYTCDHCGDTYTSDETATLAHSYTSSVTTAPGCTTDGVRTYTCDQCGDSYTESIASTGHSYSSTVTPPTCTENGYTTHTCTCGNSYTDTPIAAIGHSWSSGICANCGTSCAHAYSSNICTICSMKKPTKDYYLFGYINGADYGCEADWETLGEYRFVDGKVTAFFTQDSYVALKSGDNQDWYMLSAYYGESVTAGTFFNTT
ncbi:MAG: hypothetical protein IJW45_05080, partial [Oscillospiraceae bacterium]|nr:hypothetical protein [Oscillospiraceae bacterium]